MRADASWCGQCHAPVGTVQATPSLPEPPLRMEQVYSRWAGGPMSFGPVGRVLLTAFALLVELWLVRTNLIGAVVVGIFVLPLVLRDVWKPVPVQKRG